ncbi:Bardet-Biedl syndrome 7 protein [Dirofilaria immitis]|nr:Bardet-Biedl syndrome 7 protein [Dirofilaria immitis]
MKRCYATNRLSILSIGKIVCGNSNGIVMCFGRKNDETQIIFKTIPGPKIVCICLGGALGMVQDKIFVPMKIVSKAYLCMDRINDIICLPIVEGSWIGRGITPIIACNDKTIKVIEGSKLSYEIGLNDIPNVLHLFMNDGAKVLYGTKDGHLGLIDLSPESGKLIWEIPTKSTSVITCIHCYPITNGSTPDIIIGKEDGLIEIYTVDNTDKATFCKSHQCEDYVISVQCGRVSSPNFDEIVVCTHMGWIFGLTTEAIEKSISTSVLSPQIEVKVQQLRNEIEKLEQKLGTERQRYDEMTMEESGLTISIPRFIIQDEFKLDKEAICYTLIIELIIPIDFILLQSDVTLELIDVEKNTAVISITPSNGKSKNALLASYRCQANTTRIEIKIRPLEGQCGILQAYICPKIHPKMCQVRNYVVKPLSLHQRVHQFDSSRPLNTLKLTGNFSIAEAHQWLSLLVSEIPDRTPPQDSVTFNFSSILLGTQMQAIYSRGSLIFNSDNISTTTIIRDVLSKEVTKRQVRVDIQYDFNDQTIPYVLQLLHPKLDHHANLTKKLELCRALKELADNVEDLSYLSTDTKQIMESFDELNKEMASCRTNFDRLTNIIVNLYIDGEQMAGRNGKWKVDQLLDIIANYDYSKLLQFFTAKI